LGNVFDARLYVYSIGLIISSAIERVITSVINEHIELGTISYHTLSLFILIIIFILTNIILKPLTEKEFITKLVLGEKYLGGRWVEIVITENNEISHVTKMDIVYDNEKMNIHGDCYQVKEMSITHDDEKTNMQKVVISNFKAQKKYFFDSVCTSMDNYNLTYLFKATESMKIRQDIGQLCFEPNVKKKLDKYSGHFEDKGEKFRLAAILVEDKSIIGRMNNDFIETVGKEVLPIIINKHKLDIIEVVKGK
jgi:hypothetical protein